MSELLFEIDKKKNIIMDIIKFNGIRPSVII